MDGSETEGQKNMFIRELFTAEPSSEHGEKQKHSAVTENYHGRTNVSNFLCCEAPTFLFVYIKVQKSGSVMN